MPFVFDLDASTPRVPVLFRFVGCCAQTQYTHVGGKERLPQAGIELVYVHEQPSGHRVALLPLSGQEDALIEKEYGGGGCGAI